MSRARSSFQIKLLPTALVAALVMLGSTTVASAQSYDQGSPSDQSAPQYESAQTDPSGRVARLAYLSGDVEFAPAGESDFGSADVNRPLTTGDRLLTGNDGRAALELGGAALRIDHGSAFNFLDLNDNTAQVELSQGALNLRVQDAGQNQTYEIDTPAVAFVASRPGLYRVDVAPDGNGAMVTVFDGAGTVYGENGASRPLDAGQSYRFADPSLSNVEVAGLPSPDDFDRWAQSRDDRRQNSVSSRYVSPEVVGYDDLDDYGAWDQTPDYGNVWFPTQVSAGWAPYRDGHWAWIEPWGWTWVDDAPWGYAPFHYGRWVYVRNHWGWCPGPRQYRPVYAPALVAFVGGSGFSVSISLGGGGPVGWFPLGPRDVYVPPYRASRNYFTNVNVTNIRNVYVNKTVINNYYGNYAAQRPMNARYAYRNDPRALTAVPRNVFAGAKPVRNAVLHVPPRSLTQAQVMSRPHISPTQASLAIRQPKRPIATPARAFDRKVVAKHAPPPRPVPFATRERVIAKQGGAPIPAAQLQQMRQQHAGSKQPPQRVQVVAAKPQASKPLPPMKRVQNFSPRPGNTPVAQTPGHAPVRAPERNAGRKPAEQPRITPTRTQPPSNGAASTPRAAALRPGELPSARFAHPERNASSTAERKATGQAQQRAVHQQGQQHATQAQQAQQRTQAEREQSRQHAQQEHVQQQQAQDRADQARTQQQAQQREAAARQHDQQARSQQEQQRTQRDQQRADQARQQQEAQQREAQARQHDQQTRAQQEQAQQRARQQQQRADEARQQRDAQQREAQARQRDEQVRAQQAQMQQQRAQQAQVMQQRQAQQRAEQTRAQQQQHAPPPHQKNQPPPKKKDHDDQDNGH